MDESQGDTYYVPNFGTVFAVVTLAGSTVVKLQAAAANAGRVIATAIQANSGGNYATALTAARVR